MPQTTRPRRTMTTGRSQTQGRSSTAGRFSRPSTPSGTGRRSVQTGRRSTPTRTGFSGVMQRRKPAKQSGMRGALNSVMSALPLGGGATKRRSGSSNRGKASAGIALATAAAGLAAANRDKLTALFNRDKDSTPESMPAPTHTVTPGTTEPGGPAGAAGDATPPPRP